MPNEEEMRIMADAFSAWLDKEPGSPSVPRLTPSFDMTAKKIGGYVQVPLEIVDDSVPDYDEVGRAQLEVKFPVLREWRDERDRRRAARIVWAARPWWYKIWHRKEKPQ